MNIRLFGKILAAAVLCAVIALSFTACSGNHQKDMLLYLKFDEGSGVTVSDASGHLPSVEMNYGFSHAVFMDSQDPQWRKDGIKDGCLLFDGSTTYISYNRTDISVSGPKLTVSVWIAPRTFEWDDPNAADNGTDALTGIISQSDKANNSGFILGYERFGRLSFQVGTDSDWLTVWTNGDNLEKYKWNYVTATFDSEAGEMRLYLNGTMVSSRSVPKGAEIKAASTRGLLVGRNGEGERLTAGFLNVCSGYVDEVKLYSTALSEKEIADEYKSVTVKDIAFEDIWLQNILTDDYTRAQFHAAPYQFWMNEPHAPVYYNGKYHLFFQQNMTGSYWRNICWGHFVSDDTVNWTPVKEAITPTENTVVPDGVWSGGAALDKNGVPLLFFTAGNDGFAKVDGLISNQNIGIAYPADLNDPNLTDWIIYDELAVIQKAGQGRRGEFRDPSIWKNGDTWYMFVCSGSVSTTGGSVLLYTSNTLELKPDGTIDMDWQYKGPIYEMPNQSALYGTSWELPIVLPVSNKAGTITKFMFAFSPAPASIADNKVYYFVGDFNTETGKFTPDERFNNIPELLDYGANVFTGPSALIDPVSGEIMIFSIMQDQRSAADQGASGWAHTAGITRTIRLTDDGTDLMIAPLDTLHTLEKDVLINETNLTLEQANEKLASVDEDMLYIKVVADIGGAQEFGINLKQGGKWDRTTYTYDIAKEQIIGETENKGDGASIGYVSGRLPNENGKLEMEIFIDRSLVEAFFNNYKAISIRAYTDDPKSHGINMFAEGNVKIESLYVATMGSIFKK